MGQPDFRFAGVLGAVMVIAMMTVSAGWDLPVRDPDGVVVPTYVRLPLIVLAALALDVVPRAIARRESVVTITRERWDRTQWAFALGGVVTWYATYAAFRNLKSYVPFVNDRLWDNELASLDRWLWLGNDPAEVLHQWLGTSWTAELLSLVYVAWIVLVPTTLGVALVWTRHRAAGSWFVTAVAVDWALGVATYFAMPSLGPVYSAPREFTDIDHTMVTSLQESMMGDRVEVLADPFATGAVQTIAAFASLHVAIMVTMVLIAHLVRLPRWVLVSSHVFLVLTVISTVYLGWHFFVDAIAGAALGAAGVWIAAMATGNVVAGRPRLRQEVPRPRQRTDRTFSA